MTSREFLLWLLGYLQLCGDDRLNRKKLFIIQNHLNLVKAVEGQLRGETARIWDDVAGHLENNTPEPNLISFKEKLTAILAAA